jgi:hypothetical protein
MRHRDDAASASRRALLVDLWCGQEARSILQHRARLVLELGRLHAEIEAEMDRLCALTQPDNGMGLRLLRQRRATGALALRWADPARHTLAGDGLVQRLAVMPIEASRWYAALAIQVGWLNARERLVRHARQVMRDLSEERHFDLLIGGSIHE